MKNIVYRNSQYPQLVCLGPYLRAKTLLRIFFIVIPTNGIVAEPRGHLKVCFHTQNIYV